MKKKFMRNLRNLVVAEIKFYRSGSVRDSFIFHMNALLNNSVGTLDNNSSHLDIQQRTAWNGRLMLAYQKNVTVDVEMIDSDLDRLWMLR